MIDKLSASLAAQANALVLRARRQEVIASNIANADTPGYRAADFDFAKALKAAGDGAAAGAGMIAPVVPVLPFDDSASAGASLPPRSAGAPPAPGLGAGAALAALKLDYPKPAQPAADGNTVDMDAERAKFADNAIRYEAALRSLNSQIRTLTDAIKG